jgi:hypothetical protein
MEFVLQAFIDAFDGKVDPAFWNRIAHKTGGGSGPRYIEGWILAFSPFDDETRYCLNSLEAIKRGDRFGHIDTNDVPSCTVVVPVTIDDNGREYKTEFVAGLIATAVPEATTVAPLAGWALTVID